MELIRSIGTYLSYSKHDRHSYSHRERRREISRLVVVSAGYETAANILDRRLSHEGAWGRIFARLEESWKSDSHRIKNEGINDIVSLLESCSALKEEHSLHYGNLVATITEHVVARIESTIGECNTHSCCGYILDRICSRGFSELVVRALLRLYQDLTYEHMTFQNILKNFPEDGHGAKSFATELLGQISLLKADQDKAAILIDFIPPCIWEKKIIVQLQLGDVLITKGRLQEDSLNLLVEYLYMLRLHPNIDEDPIMSSLERAVVTWSRRESISKLSLYQEKVLANFIIKSLSMISKDDLETRDNLIPRFLKGISEHLGSPQRILQQIGMCVGNALSSTLSSDKPPIFDEKGIKNIISLDGRDPDKAKEMLVLQQRVVVEDRNTDNFEPDSDDETDSEFGFQENLEDLDEQEPERVIQLQELVKMLSSGEDKWKDQLDAVSLSADLIQASPCELTLYAESLARGLMYCRVPEWANEEIDNPKMKGFEEQRMDALLDLLVVSPDRAGVCLIDIFYSASSNLEHRAKSLQLLSTGAKAISVRSLPSGGKYNEHKHEISNNLELPRILLEWSSKLLLQCDKQQHGIDLFGKDTYLLGCLLCTLGNFMEILSGTQEALYLGTAVLKLALSDSVRNNAEVFVRRSALAATAQSISSVPTSSICVGVAGTFVGLTDGYLAETGVSATAKEFICLMNKLHTWFKSVEENEIDTTCQKLGQGGVRLVELLRMDALDEYSKQSRQSGSPTGTIQISSLKQLKSHKDSISIHIPSKEIHAGKNFP